MGKRFMRFAGAGVATAGIAVAMILGTAGSAAASIVPVNHVELCAEGNYSVYFGSSARGGWTSREVQPGQCSFIDMYYAGSSLEVLNVRGVYNTSENTFQIATVSYFPGVSGLGIEADGTTANSGAGAYIQTF